MRTLLIDGDNQTAAWLFAPGTKTERDDNWTLTTDRLKEDFAARGLPVDETTMDHVDGSHSEAHYNELLNATVMGAKRDTTGFVVG